MFIDELNRIYSNILNIQNDIKNLSSQKPLTKKLSMSNDDYNIYDSYKAKLEYIEREKRNAISECYNHIIKFSQECSYFNEQLELLTQYFIKHGLSIDDLRTFDPEITTVYKDISKVFKQLARNTQLIDQQSNKTLQKIRDAMHILEK